MGMKKISRQDEDRIVKLVRKWPRGKALTWEKLRIAIKSSSTEDADVTWTRQALSGNESIRAAYTSAKQERASTPAEIPTDGALIERIRKLEADLVDLQNRFDFLKLRHTQLAYNASLLEGGTHLLDDPLPDNTRAQRG